MSRTDLVSPETRFLTLPEGVRLRSGRLLSPVTVAYRTWGRLSAGRDNAILVCHALTGSADVDRWWGGLLGPGRSLDPDRDFVVCANLLGSCYGTTGPASTIASTNSTWGPDFPEITVRDMVTVQAGLLRALDVHRVDLVLGGSLGGMVALEWAAAQPLPLASAVVVAAPARHSAWAIALGRAQRASIRADARWNGGRYGPADPPAAGLAAARMMAMCSYRSPGGLQERFGRAVDRDGRFRCSGWLDHHGAALADRFDANSYLTLTRAMDLHDVGEGRGGWRRALAEVRLPVLVLPISSDVLYPPEEVVAVAEALPRGRVQWIRSPHGHDAFLIEIDRVNRLVDRFRRRPALSPARLAG